MELDKHFLGQKAFFEHHVFYESEYFLEEKVLFPTDAEKKLPPPILFKGKEDCTCFAIYAKAEKYLVNNSYYIGTDWLNEHKAVYVQPKLNKDTSDQVDYLTMLFDALKHPDVFEHTTDLFEIKWDKPQIQINQEADMLTPLLVVQYLQIVKSIVRKGLKKSYYKVEQNLRSRVKGKILVAQNIKQNLAKSKTLNTICSFEEFGFNGIENRILKKALVFVQRYLPTFKGIDSKQNLTHTLNYITPAFEQVSEEANVRDCQHIKVNPFFKEYKLAIELAKQILRRFGYNIHNTSNSSISTPPFWIDMSKLFELYVLGLLNEAYKNVGTIGYQEGDRANKLDYLLNAGQFKMVVDAKYKVKYQATGVNHEDIRQVSGYARLKQVYTKLDIGPNVNNQYPLIDCLIIYPHEKPLPKGEREKIDLANKKEVQDYYGVLKYGVRLPVI